MGCKCDDDNIYLAQWLPPFRLAPCFRRNGDWVEDWSLKYTEIAGSGCSWMLPTTPYKAQTHSKYCSEAEDLGRRQRSPQHSGAALKIYASPAICAADKSGRRVFYNSKTPGRYSKEWFELSECRHPTKERRTNRAKEQPATTSTQQAARAWELEEEKRSIKELNAMQKGIECMTSCFCKPLRSTNVSLG